MTDDDAEKIARIMLTADHWCSTCADSLLEKFERAFPEKSAVLDKARGYADRLRAAYVAADENSDGEPDVTAIQIVS